MRGGPVDKGRCSTITTGLVSSEHNKGIEGLAWDPARALFYVAVEKYPMRVVSIGLDGRTTELFDAEALLGGGPCSDVAGLAYDGASDALLVLCQETNRLVRVGLSPVRVLESVAVGGTQPEGVAIVGGELWIASEPNGLGRAAAGAGGADRGPAGAADGDVCEGGGDGEGGVNVAVACFAAILGLALGAGAGYGLSLFRRRRKTTDATWARAHGADAPNLRDAGGLAPGSPSRLAPPGSPPTRSGAFYEVHTGVRTDMT